MKNFLRVSLTVFFAFLLFFTVQSHANDKDIVDVPDLATLRAEGATDGTVYRVTGEIILTHQNGNRNQKYFQDDTGAIIVDDNGGIITTKYNVYDGITGLTGTLSLFNQLLQLVPTEDPGEAISEDNHIEPLEIQLADLEPAHQSMLVVVHGVSFVEPQHDNFQPSTSYVIADDSGNSTLRTPHLNARLDYFGAPIPDEAVDMVAIVGQHNANMQIFPRGLADMGITDMHNIAALRNQAIGDGTVFTLTNEVFLTYQESFRNSKYIQDETAGILIDDNPGIITTNYNIYDGITGIQGTLGVFGNMLQFVPVEDPGPATSSNNVVEPVVLTLEDYLDNFMQYQARLVTVENVYFIEAGETFVNGQIYEFTDDEFIAEFRTTFFNVDYIGDPIPAGGLHITGLPNSRATGDYLTARNWADIEALTTYAVTFEFIDEEDNAVDGVSLTFRGETINTAPYHFPEVPVGSHPYTATKGGYHLNQGVVSVVDGDLTKVVVMVEIDPDMVTEFPWEEDFDGAVFPPETWSHFALGSGGWTRDAGWAHHTFTPVGQEANSWLVTPQIHIPEDEIMLLSFIERNQFMDFYGYSGVKVSTGSGNPEHGHFTPVYESATAITGQKETMVNLADYAGKVVYIAFVYQGEDAHRWWVNDVVIDYAPEAIEVPDIATLLEQSVSPDLIYRITGEVFITHLQLPYRGQFYIQDDTGATMIDDPDGVVETEFDLYDGITGFTGKLGEFQDMFQFVPTEDPGEASSKDNEVEPLELTLSELTIDKQGLLVLVRNVHFDEDNPAEWTHNVSYFIYDETGEGEIRTPNSAGLLDYFGSPVPDTPKDIIGVLHQRFEVTRLLPRMLADFMEPGPVQVITPEIAEINVYPNPASALINIESGNSTIKMISIYNLNGQLVREVKAVESDIVTLDVSSLNNGMYLIRIVMDDKVVSHKINIAR